MQNEKNVGIRNAMRSAKLTFSQLAEIMGVSEATVYRMLSADLPDEDQETLMKIIQAYDEGRSIAK